MEKGGRFEAYIELKSSPDKFFTFLSKELHQLPTAASDRIHGVEVHEGDWDTVGSVKQWIYTADGKKEVFKEKIHVDLEKKSVSMIAVGGHCLDLYKSYKVSFQVVPKSDNIGATVGCLVTATIDYEKHKDDSPRPYHYLDLVIDTVKDIDTHLLKA